MWGPTSAHIDVRDWLRGSSMSRMTFLLPFGLGDKGTSQLHQRRVSPFSLKKMVNVGGHCRAILGEQTNWGISKFLVSTLEPTKEAAGSPVLIMKKRV